MLEQFSLNEKTKFHSSFAQTSQMTLHYITFELEGQFTV